MEVFKYIRAFDFPESIRDQVTFSDSNKIRLDAQDHKLKLTEDIRGYPYPRYSMDADLWIKLPITNPLAHKVWRGLQVMLTQPANTDVQYRLHDGVDEYYWDGGAWVVSTTNWNTLVEINDNMSSFLSQNNGQHNLGLVINLISSDGESTPEIDGYKILMDVFFSEYESVLVDSLTEYFKQISITGDFDFNDTSIVTTIDLKLFDLGKLNITNVTEVYNISIDPDMMNDILDNYNPTTKIVTLSTSLPANDTARLKLVYSPTVAITTHQDYIELASVPAIVIEDIRVVEILKAPEGGDFVRADADTGWQMPEIDNVTFRAKVVMQSELLVDQMRLLRHTENHLRLNKQLHWKDTDEHLDMIQSSPYASAYRPSLDSTLSGSFEFELRYVPFYIDGASEIPIIKTVDVALSK